MEVWKQIGTSDELCRVAADAAERFLKQLQWTNILSPRCLVILWEHPNISTNRSLYGNLLTAVLKLPQKFLQDLTEFWKQLFLDVELYKQKIASLQDFLTVCLLDSSGLPQDSPHVAAAAKVMQMLYDLQPDSIPYDFFYNDLVNSATLENLREDFTNWKGGEGFSFCTTPCLLDAATKSRVLQLENKISMMQQARGFYMGFSSFPVLIVEVRRSHVIPDVLQMMMLNEQEDPRNFKRELRVKFEGEEGIDEGGVRKELFQIIIRDLFDAQYGMFKHDPETRTVWFRSTAFDLEEFKLIGMFMGLAIYNSIILDVHLPKVVYKKLLGLPVGLEDMKDFSPSMYKSFRKLLDAPGDVSEWDLTFQVALDSFDSTELVELKEGGAGIPVTNANREEYVELYTKLLLVTSIQTQYEAFERGFKMICDTDALHLFRSEELELLICGTPELDFRALEKNTTYADGFEEDHPVIRFFWNTVHSLSEEQKKKLLFFATGSDRSPIGGLSKLPLVITPNGDDPARLPTAHTCFNHLLLPKYQTEEQLRVALLLAIQNSEGFGMI